MQSCDAEIRIELHRKRLHSYHSCPDTLVIDELGVAHGKQRIDIAVINGTLHGYEIKSSKDNLKRLPSQLNAYQNCFENLSIVTAPEHLNEIFTISPEWCEIISADKQFNGEINFSIERDGKRNPEIKLISVLHFLWKREALELLVHLGKIGSYKHKSRVDIYDLISEVATLKDALEWIKKCFKSRNNWIIDAQPLSNDDWFPPASR